MSVVAGPQEVAEVQAAMDGMELGDGDVEPAVEQGGELGKEMEPSISHQEAGEPEGQHGGKEVPGAEEDGDHLAGEEQDGSEVAKFGGDGDEVVEEVGDAVEVVKEVVEEVAAAAAAAAMEGDGEGLDGEEVVEEAAAEEVFGEEGEEDEVAGDERDGEEAVEEVVGDEGEQGVADRVALGKGTEQAEKPAGVVEDEADQVPSAPHAPTATRDGVRGEGAAVLDHPPAYPPVADAPPTPPRSPITSSPLGVVSDPELDLVPTLELSTPAAVMATDSPPRLDLSQTSPNSATEGSSGSPGTTAILSEPGESVTGSLTQWPSVADIADHMTALRESIVDAPATALNGNVVVAHPADPLEVLAGNTPEMQAKCREVQQALPLAGRATTPKELVAYTLQRCDGSTSRATELLLSLSVQYKAIEQWSSQNPALAQVEEGSCMEEVLRAWFSLGEDDEREGDIEVLVESNEIGITVENILESTVVHVVKTDSAASSLGVNPGALLLRVHDKSTQGISHYEIVDALRRAPRPTRLRFRPTPDALLADVRERMHALVSPLPPPATSPKSTSLTPPPPPFTSSVGMASAMATQAQQAAAKVGAVREKFEAPPRHHNGVLDLDGVVPWACRQLRVILLSYCVALAGLGSGSDVGEGEGGTSPTSTICATNTTPTAGGSGGDGLSPRSHYQILDVLQMLCVFDTIGRQSGPDPQSSMASPTRSSSMFHYDMINAQVSAVVELVNELIFGLPGTPPPPTASDDQPGADQAPHTPTHGSMRHQLGAAQSNGSSTWLVDWGSDAMLPLFSPLAEVMIVLLEADLDVPLAAPNANLLSSVRSTATSPPHHNLMEGEVAADGGGEQSKGWVEFDNAQEPTMVDGAGSVLLVVLTRAIKMAMGGGVAGRMGVHIAARLASSHSDRARLAAARLTLDLYHSAQRMDRLLLRGVGTRLLIQAKEPPIRAGAVRSIQRLGRQCCLNDIDWLVLLCDAAASDTDTTVRRGGFEFSLRILHRLPDMFPPSGISFDGTGESDIELHLLRCKLVAVVQKLIEDREASVRHAVAAHCASLCTLLGGGRLGDQWATWTVDTLHNLLRDADVEVRSVAVKTVPFVISLLRAFAHRYIYRTNSSREAAQPASTTNAPKQAPKRRKRRRTPDRLPAAGRAAFPTWAEVEREVDCAYDGYPHEAHADRGAASLTVASMAVSGLKRALGMILLTLWKMSSEEREDLQQNVGHVLGNLVQQIADEYAYSALYLCEAEGLSEEDRASCRNMVSRGFGKDIADSFLKPLLANIVKDKTSKMSSAFLSESPGLDSTFADPERFVAPLSAVSCPTENIIVHHPSDMDWSASTKSAWMMVNLLPDSVIAQLTDLLEARTKLADWRERALAANGIPALARFVSTGQTQKRLMQVADTLLSDKTRAVRVAAAEALCITSCLRRPSDHSLLAEPATAPAAPSPTTRESILKNIRGSRPSVNLPPEPLEDWTEAFVLPRAIALVQQPSSKERILGMSMVQCLISLGGLGSDMVVGVLLPLVINSVSDRVANVRIAATITLHYMVKSVAERDDQSVLESLSEHTEFLRSLETLCSDSDAQAAYVAKAALEFCSPILNAAAPGKAAGSAE